MAYEFAYFNDALSVGDKYKLGCGESLGRMICDKEFQDRVFALTADGNASKKFAHPQVSVLAACYENTVPFTAHVGIGTDVIDQHPSFDGRAKGGCSGRDFLIYTQEISQLTDGGVVLNIGSAVTGPEVLLTAKSSEPLVPKIAALLRQEHPYQVPELAVVPIAAGSPDYLRWLEESLK